MGAESQNLVKNVLKSTMLFDMQWQNCYKTWINGIEMAHDFNFLSLWLGNDMDHEVYPVLCLSCSYCFQQPLGKEKIEAAYLGWFALLVFCPCVRALCICHIYPTVVVHLRKQLNQQYHIAIPLQCVAVPFGAILQWGSAQNSNKTRGHINDAKSKVNLIAIVSFLICCNSSRPPTIKFYQWLVLCFT